MVVAEGQRDRKEVILTDNSVEQIKIVWDGERFGILKYDKSRDESALIILNPREAQELRDFICEVIIILNSRMIL